MSRDLYRGDESSSPTNRYVRVIPLDEPEETFDDYNKIWDDSRIWNDQFVWDE